MATDKSQPVEKEQRRSKERRPIAVPLITGLVLVLAFCAYYFVYVPERREYLTNRNFRALAVLGNQLERSVNIHATVLEMFAHQKDQIILHKEQRRKQPLDNFLWIKGDRVTREDHMQYLRFLAPNFELEEINDAAEHAAFAVNRRNGAWNIELATSNKGTAVNEGQRETYVGAIKVSDLLQPFVASLPFNDILLASQTGVIVYEKSLFGPQFTTLHALLGNEALSAQQASDAKTSEDSSHGRESAEGSLQVQLNSDKAWQNRSVHLTEVSLAGTKYTVFLQPVVIDYGASTQTPTEKPREWVLCGLTKSKTLEWEALSVSYTAVIWIVAVFLIVCLGAPILKVFLLNNWERLKLGELAFIGLFFVLLASVCTLASLQAVYYHIVAENTDENLNHVASKLASNVHLEMQQMRKQLVQACAAGEIVQDLGSAADIEVVRRLSKDAWKDGLMRTPEKQISEYRYFDNVFWTDADGHEIVKWGTSSYVTPMIDISSLASYKRLSDPEHHSLMYLDGEDPPFVFDSVIPPNKLDYLAVMGMRTCACNKELCKPNTGLRPDETSGYAFIVARPFSLLQPLLPYGYTFALIDGSGSVLFHSDKTRNTLENFFEESDNNLQLYAAMFGHANSKAISITYMGKPYRARVLPIDGLSHAPWSLVVFRDLTFARTLYLQTASMTATLFVTMLSAPVVLALIWRSSCRTRFAAEWLWPHKGRVFTYFYLAALYGILNISLLLIASFSGSEETLISCFAIPYSALAFTFWAVRLLPSGTTEACHASRRELVAGLIVSGAGLAAFVSLLLIGWTYAHLLWFVLPVWAAAAVPLFRKPQRSILRGLLRNTSKASWLGDSYRTLYLVSALLLLLLVSVLPPVILFRDLRGVEGRLYVKDSQLHLANAAERERALLGSQCELQQRSLPECAEFKRSEMDGSPQSQPDPPSQNGWSRESLLPLYQDTREPGFETHSIKGSPEFYAPWFQHLIYALHHDYNRPAAEMLGVIADRGTPKAVGFNANSRGVEAVPEWAWAQTKTSITLKKHGSEPAGDAAENDSDIVLRSNLRNYAGRDTAISIGICAFVLALIGGVFRAAANRVFLFQVIPHRITGRRQASEALQSGKDVVVLVPPAMKWEFDIPVWPLHLDEIATSPQWAEEFDLNAIPTNKLVEIRYSDTNQAEAISGRADVSLDELEKRGRAENQKILFLQRLQARPGTQLAVIVVVGASREEFTKTFPSFEVIDLREQPVLWEEAYSGPAGASLWKECAPLPVLWPLGAQLASELRKDNELQPGRVYTASSVAVDVLEKAEPYYKMIWDECSPLQKFVLSQLARDGVPNPSNDRILQQFVRSGLIVKDPQFRIMNESFRRYLVAAPPARLKDFWTRESHKTGWGKAHGALFTVMLVVGGFLLTTQNELWQSSAAYVTTALGALGTLAKLFSNVRGGGIPAADKES